MKKMLGEFKKFAIKGNAVDLAVGVVIGAAFGSIVTSLVADIINPVLGIFTGGVDFSNKVLRIGDATINYGKFLTTIIDFIIIAWAIFLVVRYMNKMMHHEEQNPTPVKPSEEVELLTEIRDSLNK